MTGVEMAGTACATFHGLGMLYLLVKAIGLRTFVSGLLIASVLVLGMKLDRNEEAAAKAFMAECREGHTYRDCLLRWGGDTYVFEGEPM